MRTIDLDKVWHDTTETPDDEAEVLVLTESKAVINCYIGISDLDESVIFHINWDADGRTLEDIGAWPIKWAYVEDLIPKQQDDEKLGTI